MSSEFSLVFIPEGPTTSFSITDLRRPVRSHRLRTPCDPVQETSARPFFSFFSRIPRGSRTISAAAAKRQGGRPTCIYKWRLYTFSHRKAR
jgi:hypothetical protein